MRGRGPAEWVREGRCERRALHRLVAAAGGLHREQEVRIGPAKGSRSLRSASADVEEPGWYRGWQGKPPVPMGREALTFRWGHGDDRRHES